MRRSALRSDFRSITQTALSDDRRIGMDAGTYDPDLDLDGRVAMRIVDELADWLGHVPDRATGNLRP